MQNFEEPSTILSPFIERYWWKDISQSTSLLNIYPNTGAELTFHFQSPFYYLNPTEKSVTPSISLLYLTKSSIKLLAENSISFVSIRFRTGMLHHFLPNLSMSDIDNFTDASDIYGSEILKYYDMLLLEKNRQKQKEILEAFLLKQLQNNYKENREIDHLSKLFYYKCDELNVNDAANKIGISRRQLLRKCNTYYGISPKEYLSIARFNKVLKGLLTSEKKEYLSQALESGYFDQAHFIHNFRDITGSSPKCFFSKNKEVSHFYNTSLATSSYIATTV